LNGLWDYAIRPRDESRPSTFDGKILVPFPVESALSGVKKEVGEGKRLWYRRTFARPVLQAGERLLLHFGAVDWESEIHVNGRQVGHHRGGYDPFSLDISDVLTGDAMQEVVVSVWDPSERGYQPRGKQVSQPEGIWYTSVTGIWQTVWLESVPRRYVRRLKITPDVDASLVRVEMDVQATADELSRLNADVRVQIGDQVVARGTATAHDGRLASDIKLANFKHWSPDTPFLYDVHVQLDKGEGADQVTSYFGMRKIEVKRDTDGFNRLFLNGKPLFHFGPLDQGWWPDGLYTAPTDEALRHDIEMTKRLGFNMCRKHVKVEPQRWYYHCDRLGLMVWQDMPNGDRHIRPGERDITRSAESAENFHREYQALIDARYHHPCIVTWVPFNEGWGQFETDRVLAWTKEYDPTRLVDGPSGWTDRGTGDIHDMHRYPGPGMPAPEEKRAVVLGEFGGLGLPVKDHLWWDKRNWGYRTYKTVEELRQNYDVLMSKLRPLIGRGLAGAIYTQTTDVEGEVNGLMTYDRALVKFDPEHMTTLHRRFYLPPLLVSTTTVLPTSQEVPQTWRYTTSQPADNWMSPEFNDGQWRQGPAGFGEESTPGAIVRSAWKSNDIWLRRRFELNEARPRNPHLRIHHDEDARVYVNGTLVATLPGYESGYADVELGEKLSRVLQSGENIIAVHCRQTDGGQYIDVGIVDVVETPRDP
jgi:hypothetical protein